MNWKLAFTIANPALRRGARTFIQAFLGVATAAAVTPFVIAAITGDAVDVHALRALVAAGAAAGLTAVWSWAQNAFEDATGKSLVVEKHQP